MRMGAEMMRLSDRSLTPARTGLIIATVLVFGAIVVRVIAVSEHSEVRTHTTGQNGGPLDIGIADLKGSLP